MSQTPHSTEPGDDPTTEYVRLLNKHERRIGAYVMGLVPNWADADEIVQETRVRLWQQFANYQPDKDFGSWACTIAHYLVLDYRKRKGRQHVQFSDALAETLAGELAAIPEEPRRQEEALSQCLERLSKRSRNYLRKYYSGEATVEQMASDEGNTPSAVYKALTSARMFLYECVDKTLDEE